jgi:hypothetical protein
MKKSLLISISMLFICSFPTLTQAQNYVEGEVIVKYKNAEFQTTAQGIQLLLPEKEPPKGEPLPTPFFAPQLLPCEKTISEETISPEENAVSIEEGAVVEEENLVSTEEIIVEEVGKLVSSEENTEDISPQCLSFAPEQRTSFTFQEPIEEIPLTVSQVFSIDKDLIAVME